MNPHKLKDKGMNDTSSNYQLLVIFIIVVLLIFLYKKTRRISKISHLPSDLKGRWLTGKVVWVSDGDGFMFYHVPWFRSAHYEYGEPKLSVRLAGIDAPKTAYHGKPAQPFANEAKDALAKIVLYQDVKLKLLKLDKYNRLIAICYKSGWFFPTNVNKKMIELGLARVSEGSDAVYDDYKEEFCEAQSKARRNQIGNPIVCNSRLDRIARLEFKTAVFGRCDDPEHQ